jgi:hypothetical protein
MARCDSPSWFKYAPIKALPTPEVSLLPFLSEYAA